MTNHNQQLERQRPSPDQGTDRIAPAGTASAPADIDPGDLRRACAGDSEAFARLLRSQQTQVSAMMWRFTRDDRTHRELVQDVFVEVYHSLASFKGKAPFAHWVACIATRTGYRFWKEEGRRRKNPTVGLDEWDQLPTSAPDAMSPSEAAETLHALLAHLSPRDRMVVTLRFVDGRSAAETARLMGWSETMVKVQTWRARQKLKALFGQFERGRKETPCTPNN